MTSIIPGHQFNWSVGVEEHHLHRARFNKIIPYSRYFGSNFPSKGLFSSHDKHISGCGPIFCSAVDDGNDPDDGSGDDTSKKKESPKDENGVNSELLRENLERIVGVDDSTFSGLDLATLIRKKYGRSYDVQLIKKYLNPKQNIKDAKKISKPVHVAVPADRLKEFMGRNLLALNVMWKYMEQRSFPLTEEEYILRLDDVANTLKCWGAVSHIRNSLAKLKERPRIGKAVSIFIDMDESGGRANEWIYK